jgi:hypothetical protein
MRIDFPLNRKSFYKLALSYQVAFVFEQTKNYNK